MSNPPPLPPEIGNNVPQSQAKPDYVEIEVPVNDDSPTVIQKSNGNCLYGCGGLLGMFLIVAGLCAGVLYLGVGGVNDAMGEFTNLFNLPPIYINWGPGELDIPDDIYIPPVERVQSLSELTTTRYNYAEVVSSQVDMPAWLSTLYGDSVVMVLVGTVEAGIDVSQISEEDIVFDETTNVLTVMLPAPVLQSCFLDESQSYVVQRNTAVFADPVDNIEDSLRGNALRFYRDTAIEEGILLDAETDARESLVELLGILVNDETVTINILFESRPAEVIYPDSCQ